MGRQQSLVNYWSFVSTGRLLRRQSSMWCTSYVRRIARCSELTVRNGIVWRSAKGRIVTKQDKFPPGGLADNFTQQLCRATSLFEAD